MSIIQARSVTFRYRVAELHHIYSNGESADVTDQREFRTLKAAQRHRDKLAARGRSAMIQTGVLQWLPNDEASQLLRQLAKDMVIE